MAIQKLKVFPAGNRMATRCEAETILRVNNNKTESGKLFLYPCCLK